MHLLQERRIFRTQTAFALVALAAVIAVVIVITAGFVRFTTYRPQPRVVILDALPLVSTGYQATIDGAVVNGAMVPLVDGAFHVKAGLPVQIRGWGIDRRTGTGISGVQGLLDGRVVRGVAGIRRPDVASVFRSEGYTDSGFYVELLASEMRPGIHQISFRFVGGEMVDAYDSAPIRIVCAK